jgi:hypothetical protein
MPPTSLSTCPVSHPTSRPHYLHIKQRLWPAPQPVPVPIANVLQLDSESFAHRPQLSPVPTANVLVLDSVSIADRLTRLHLGLLRPDIITWCKAIENDYYLGRSHQHRRLHLARPKLLPSPQITSRVYRRRQNESTPPSQLHQNQCLLQYQHHS